MAQFNGSVDVRGVLPALLTPLTSGYDVDVPALERLVDRVLAGGVHGLWLLGSTGEFTALSPVQRDHVIDVAVRGTAGRVPVIVGVADNNLRTVLASLDRAAELGANGAFVLLPFYFCVDEQEAEAYFDRIVRDSPLPILIYDNPACTRVKLPTQVLSRIAAQAGILGIKDSSGDFIRFEQFAASAESGGWRLLQGDERLAGASVLLGGHGLVAALANIAPRLFVDLYEAARGGDISRVKALQRRIHELLAVFEIKSGPTDGSFFAGLKAALQVMGIAGRTVSPPFAPMPDEKMDRVRELLVKCEIL